MLILTVSPNDKLKEKIKEAFPTRMMPLSIIPIMDLSKSGVPSIEGGDYEEKDIYFLSRETLLKLTKKLSSQNPDEIETYTDEITQNYGTDSFFKLSLSYIYKEKNREEDFRNYTVNIGENPSINSKESLVWKLDHSLFFLLEQFKEGLKKNKKFDFNPILHNFPKNSIENKLLLEFYNSISDILLFREHTMMNDMHECASKMDFLHTYLSPAEKAMIDA